MFAWFSANLINIVLVAVLVLLTGLLVRIMLRDRKAGKSSCGGNCSACGVCGACAGCRAAERPRKGGSSDGVAGN